MNYLLVGPEEYLKSQFLDKLKKSVLKENESRLDFEVFRAGESEIYRILDSFNTLPFISKHRITVIKDINRFSVKEKESILKYLKSPLGSTTLVLESPSDESGKFLRDVARFASPVKCVRLKDGEVIAWIKREFTARKKKITPPAAVLIRELAGNDLFRLKNEIEKIASFSGDRNEISETDVEKVLGEAPYKTAFELVDLILQKKPGKVMASLERLLVKEKPNQILNLLAWQFRNFIKIKNLPDKSSPDEAARTLGISWGFAKRAAAGSKRFTQAELEKNLETILEADLFIKRGILDPKHALERVLVGLCK